MHRFILPFIVLVGFCSVTSAFLSPTAVHKVFKRSLRIGPELQESCRPASFVPCLGAFSSNPALYRDPCGVITNAKTCTVTTAEQCKEKGMALEIPNSIKSILDKMSEICIMKACLEDINLLIKLRDSCELALQADEQDCDKRKSRMECALRIVKADCGELAAIGVEASALEAVPKAVMDKCEFLKTPFDY